MSYEFKVLIKDKKVWDIELDYYPDKKIDDYNTICSTDDEFNKEWIVILDANVKKVISLDIEKVDYLEDNELPYQCHFYIAYTFHNFWNNPESVLLHEEDCYEVEFIDLDEIDEEEKVIEKDEEEETNE